MIVENFRDILNKWIILLDAKSDSTCNDLLKVNDNGLVALIYSDHQAGISARISFSCKYNNLEIEEIGETAKPTMTVLRYGYFMKRNFRLLNEAELIKFKLDVTLETIGTYYNENHYKIQLFEELDQFRAEGYPDDVKVILPGIGGKNSEQVWVKLEKFDKSQNLFIGNLLNEPNQDFKVHQNDRIEVLYYKADDNDLLICKTVLDKNKNS